MNLLEVEIYDVDKETIKRLDMLEGHPRWYQRIKVKTLCGEEVEIYHQPVTGMNENWATGETIDGKKIYSFKR